MVADPARWEAPTACTGWEVRDVIGHLVDATEGYFPDFEIARNGGTPDEPLGLAGMAVRADEHARAFRSESRDEMLDRLHERLGAGDGRTSPALSDEDWTGLIVSHPYMGPIPAMFYPMFQMVDYAVHTWDIREGMGEPHGLSGDAADLLVPVIFILWQATADTSGVTSPYSVGVRTSGRNGGDMRLDVSSEGVQYAPGSIDDCAAIDRVRSGDPGAHGIRTHQRRHGPRRPAGGQQLPLAVLPDLTAEARPTWSGRSHGCCEPPSTTFPTRSGSSPRTRAHVRRRARPGRTGRRRAAGGRRRPRRPGAGHRPQHRPTTC